jgi:hypothetical protein
LAEAAEARLIFRRNRATGLAQDSRKPSEIERGVAGTACSFVRNRIRYAKGADPVSTEKRQ